MLTDVTHGSRTVFWGLAVLAFGYSVVLPWYFILHLLTSPMAASSSTPAPKLKDYDLKMADIASVIPAMLLGFIVPTVMMALPAPSVLSYERKQMMIANWHAFPLYVGVAQLLISFALRSLFSSNEIKAKRAQQTQSQEELKSNIWALRVLYAFLLLCGARDQLTTNHFVFLAQAFPALFAPESRGLWSFTNVFGQKSITPSVKMDSVGSGALLFLQYDENIGNVALILWAAVLFVRARRRNDGLRNKVHVGIVLGVGFVTVAFTGAMGLATGLIWGRDEIVFFTERGKEEEREESGDKVEEGT